MGRDIAVASGTMKGRRALDLVWPLLFVVPASAHAQDAARSCKFICDLEWKFEPTFTIENLAMSRLGFTAELSAAPFRNHNSAELEFETNVHG